MKIAIMQPYFFPYFGYFQLIHSVEIFVNLEHVNFIKRSYMTRNKLKNNTLFNIPVSNGSQNKLCTEVYVLSDEKWFLKFEKTLYHLYKDSLNYNIILNEVILPWKKIILENKNIISISEFNLTSIKLICNYLDIKTEFHSSVGITNKKKNEGLQEITSYFNSKNYINAIGGKNLYNKEDFLNKGIELNFIEMGELPFDEKYLSTLDLLFNYEKELLKKQLNNYNLI